MNKSPLVSILIPNFNKGKYLRETLNSVINQSYTNWECIIVDDHSTDNSWEILNEYSRKDYRIKVYKRPDYRKKGGNAARNFAFELSKGEFINWLDSDDLFTSKKIENQLKIILELNSDLVLSKLANENNKLPEKKFYFIDEFNSHIRPIKFLTGDFWFSTSTPLFKRKFILLNDFLFNEDLRRNQESEYFAKLLINNPKIGFIDEVHVIRRYDDNSIFSNYKKLSPKDQINSDFPIFLNLANYFKEKDVWGPLEKEYFVNWYLKIIQYSNLSFPFFFKLFFLTIRDGKWNQIIIFFKSIIYRLFNSYIFKNLYCL
ncbi:glycosyltransferase family 2 protein [Algoriphagus sp. CAU 1675]|uniref:glycosyltransferase family 2 protein n=1 Tax=Algoriphagus sp. CAU 1675 TaxID=3032597 RepID=UPI0023DBAD5E|nr:glycosyltransferase family 2 protein [Algoriphagus sp. CAU 1675]MDF2159406.1 glycosyltransferase family 2 protein [Algoriphagus sp. CAU 1675]